MAAVLNRVDTHLEIATSWHDEERLTEVELCTTLMIASSGADRRLTRAEVDHLLGVRLSALA